MSIQASPNRSASFFGRCVAAIAALPVLASVVHANSVTINGVPFPSIQAAVNAVGAGQTIVIGTGDYFEPLISIVNKPAGVTLMSTGLATIHGPVLISNCSPTISVLRFTRLVTGTTGMSIVDASPTFDNCFFTNYEAGLGGAVKISTTQLWVTPPKTTFESCTFDSNKAQLGGAIYVMPEIINQKTAPDLKCQFCLFQSNGAVPDDDGADVVFGGGAVYIGEKSTAVFDSCQWFDNASGGYGGAIMADGPELLDIHHSLIQRNTCEEQGGGVWLNMGEQWTIHDTVFADNHAINPHGFATSGGGLFASGSESNPTPDIFNCLFTRNSARAGGGATLYGLNANVGHCTFSQNHASWTGGGMVLTNTFVTLSNSILFGNTCGVTPSNATWVAEINWGTSSGLPGAPIVITCDVRGSSQPTWLPAIGSSVPPIDADPVFMTGLYSCKFTPADVSGFFLRSVSPCVNTGSGTFPAPPSAPWQCTSRGGVNTDIGTADIGFHYPDINCP